MGFDCGFDIFPRLELNDANKQAYQEFLDEVTSTYKDAIDNEGLRPDGKILALPGCFEEYDKSFIWFVVGEMPHMPSTPDRCNYFLRFSSKVSGRRTAPAAGYIREVRDIARKHFGTRVHYWHEMDETDDDRQWGCYDWSEVQAAEREVTEMSLRTGHEHRQ